MRYKSLENMVDIAKIVAHCRTGAVEDWQVATELVERGHVRHGLFFAHLALEKALKAAVSQHTGDLAPPIHDLIRVANAAGLAVDDHRREVLGKMNAYSVAGRYPDALVAVVSVGDAKARLASAKEVFEWLMGL